MSLAAAPRARPPAAGDATRRARTLGAALTRRAAGWSLWGLLVLGPTLALLLALLRAPEAARLPAFFTGAELARHATLLLRSTLLAAAVAGLAFGIGALAALPLWRLRRPWARRARWVLLALAVVPPYVHALAWTAFGRGLLRLVGLPPGANALGGDAPAAVWILAMAWLPMALGLALLGLESLPDDRLEAARCAAPDGAVLARVVVPGAAPLWAAALALPFVLALLDYSVPALLQVPTYALAIFADFSAHHRPERALALSLPLVVVAALGVAGVAAGLRATPARPDRRPARPAARPRGPAWLRALEILALLVLALQILVPLVGLALASGGPSTALAALRAAAGEAGMSLALAAGAALASLPLGLGAALALRRAGALAPARWAAVLAPLALPAPLVGIGLIALWGRAGPAGALYGTAAMPLLAALARFAPVAALLLLAGLRRRDDALWDAARTSASPPAAWLRVGLPLLAPPLLAAAALVFALTLGELGATLLVVPPGGGTLTLRIYTYLHYGATDAVAGLCLAMALVAALCGALAMLLLAGPPERRGARGDAR